MQTKASAKGGTKNRKARGKLLDLPAKRVKRDDAGSIKGGIIVGNSIGTDATGTRASRE